MTKENKEFVNEIKEDLKNSKKILKEGEKAVSEALKESKKIGKGKSRE